MAKNTFLIQQIQLRMVCKISKENEENINYLITQTILSLKLIV